MAMTDRLPPAEALLNMLEQCRPRCSGRDEREMLEAAMAWVASVEARLEQQEAKR